MTQRDESFAIMLLMSQIDPGKNELVLPLSFSEWHGLHRSLREQGLGMADLFDMDMSGLMMRLKMSEQEAYRLCVLLGRVLPLSVSLERFAMNGIRPVTWNQREYPRRLKERLGDKAPPLLYVAGRSELFQQEAVGIVGAARKELDGDLVRKLTRMLVEKGYTILSDGAPGAGRLAEQEALKAGGRVIEVAAGGMNRRIGQRDMLAMLELNQGVALSLTHPDAPYTASHARLHNRCLYGLATAVFVFGAKRGRSMSCEGAMQALQRGWIDHVYLQDLPGCPDGGEVLLKGATPLGRLDREIFENMHGSWRETMARQTSLFDR